MTGRRKALSPNAGILIALVAITATLGILGFATEASASTYTVRECTNEPVGAVDAAKEENAANFTAGSSCGFAGGYLEVRSAGLVGPGLFSQWALTAPSGTQIDRATAFASLAGNSDPDGNQAYIFVRPVGGFDRIDVATSGGSTSGPYDTSLRGTGPIDRIGIGMTCTHSGAQGNCSQRPMYSQMSNIALQMRDTEAPAVPKTGGTALAGWVTGTKTVGFDLADEGAGLAFSSTTVNGGLVDIDSFCAAATDSSGAVTTMAPCPGSGSASTALKLTEAPFREGVNLVQVCARDYGDNAQISCRTDQIHVDNVPPRVAFSDRQDAQDPDKLIAPVGDATSGVIGGRISYRPEGGEWTPLETRLDGDHLEARVDSAQLQPGVRYDFRATALDRAGNETTSNLRSDGSQMSVVGPLRTLTDIVQLRVNGKSQATVGYAKGGVLTGKVVGRDGSAVAGAPVVVREKFAAGADRNGATSSAKTDGDGRFRVPLEAGPSRAITARYVGDRRYLDSGSGEAKLAVRAKVGLAARPRVRAGGAVNFTGTLKARGAKLPKAGKRLEVQVKIGPKWKTVGRSTTTDRKGAYRLHYRFIAAYVQPTRFTFRTVVPRERSWPYLTAVSQKRQIVVYP